MKSFQNFIAATTTPCDHLNPRGYIEIEDENGVQLLGDNLVLTSYRQLIGAMLSDQLSSGASAYPMNLVLGKGTTVPDRVDTQLEDVYNHLGTKLLIPRQAVNFDPASTDVKVSFEFILPANLQAEGPSGETTEFQINEWGMEAADGVLLTRKVKTYTKTPGSVATVRWVIYI